jgi:hypothetical protein
VESFARHFHCSPDQLGAEQIRAYQVYLITERKLNARTVGHHTAALRFFFCKTLKRNYPVEEVPYPKAPRRLPIILTQEEAVRLIDSASNLFHRARYTHRVAISNYRIVQVADGNVTFRWKDHARKSKQRLMTASAEEFLWRFLLRTLPRGFVRISLLRLSR